MSRHSRSTLFLMEQLVVILIFAICAAACVKIFVESYLMERRALDVSNALLSAQSAAECFKASAGDAEKAAALLGGNSARDAKNNAVSVFYDGAWDVENWSQSKLPLEPAFILRIIPKDGGHPSLAYADVTVSTYADDEELVTLTVAARRDGG